MNEFMGVSPITMMMVMGAMGMAPFVVMMITSYAKLVIVFSLLRNAMGIQQVPPNMVLNGMAVILTVFIMAPVAYDIRDEFLRRNGDALPSMASVYDQREALSNPVKNFLIKHSTPKTRLFFRNAALKLWPRSMAASIEPDSFLIIVPSFMLTELTEAFQMAFLLYLPFIVIDLVVSNILLAMGMMMVSPMTISLPFKLLLFVMLSGWSKVIQGLLLSYR